MQKIGKTLLKEWPKIPVVKRDKLVASLHELADFIIEV